MEKELSISSSVADLSRGAPSPKQKQTPKSKASPLSSSKSFHVSEVDRAIAAGTRTLVNGIAFPTDVAKRLIRSSTVATQDTFVLTCFVDLFLRPPNALHSPLEPLGEQAPESRVSNVSRAKTSLGGRTRSAVFVSDSDGERSPREGSQGTISQSAPPQPLRQQLVALPKGPYLVRVPSSATVAEAAAIVQTELRRIQQRERLEIRNAMEMQGKAALYGHAVKDIDEIARQRDRSGLPRVALDSRRSSKSEDRLGSAQRRASLLSGGSRLRRFSSAGTTPESGAPLQHPSQQQQQQPQSNSPNVSSAPFAKQSPDDVLGATHVTLQSLASLEIDIPDVDEVVTVVQPVDASANAVYGVASLFGFEAFGISPGAAAAKKAMERRALHVAPISGLDCGAAFRHRRLTLRPCDDLGRVLRRRSSSNHGSMSPQAPGYLKDFDNPAAKLLQCFPKGATSFCVCLAPDAEYHRELIRDLQAEMVRTQAEERLERQQARDEAIAEMEEAWSADNRSRVERSITLDAALRAQLRRPTATDSFKAFVKQEASEEYQKQKAWREQRRVDGLARVREERMRAVEGFLKQSYIAEYTWRLRYDELRENEDREWTSMMQECDDERRAIQKRDRVHRAFSSVAGAVDAVALCGSALDRLRITA